MWSTMCHNVLDSRLELISISSCRDRFMLIQVVLRYCDSNTRLERRIGNRCCIFSWPWSALTVRRYALMKLQWRLRRKEARRSEGIDTSRSPSRIGLGQDKKSANGIVGGGCIDSATRRSAYGFPRASEYERISSIEW